jgi:glucose-1-phosphate cytidylyltransferase
MKTVLLAGGMGTRISEESHLRPKPMIEIGDAPILWHIMKYYSHFGHNDFIICCGYKGHIIKEYFADYYLHRSDVTFDFSNHNSIKIHSNVSEPWRVTVVDTGQNSQTGFRIKKIRKFVGDEPFFMTYGDGVANVNLHKLLRRHNDSNKTVTLTAIQPSGRFGVLALDETNSAVIGFREKADGESTWINAGFMVMNSKVFDYIDDQPGCVFEKKPLESLSAHGELGVYKHSGFWQCMDTQRDKIMLDKLWNSGQAKWKVWP